MYRLVVVENVSLDGVMQSPVDRTRTPGVASTSAAGRLGD